MSTAGAPQAGPEAARAGEATFGRRAVLNAALLSTGAIVCSYVGGMVVSILVARSLGPEEYGRYAYVVWLAGILVALLSGGFNNTAMRYVSESAGRGARELGRPILRHLRSRFLAALAVGVAVLLVAWPWARPQGVEAYSWTLLAIVAVAFTTKALFMFEASGAKGFGQFWVESICLIALSVLNVGVVLVLWRAGAGLLAYLGWFAALSVAHVLLVLVLFRPAAAAPSPALDPSLVSRMRGHLLWSVVLAVVAVFASKSFEVLLLNATATPVEVAYFTIALSLTRSGVDLVVGGMSSVLMPVMSHAYGAGGMERVRTVFARSTRYFQFVGILIAGLGFFWAEPAIALMYGSRYREVVPVLQIVVVGSCLPLGISAYVALLSATENQRLRVWFSAISMGLSGVLAVALVPWLHLPGALASLIASNWLGVVLVMVVTKRNVGFAPPLGALSRQFLAALPAAALAFALCRALPGHLGDLLAGATYALALLAGSLLARAWSAMETATAAAALRRVPGLEAVSRWIAGRGAP